MKHTTVDWNITSDKEPTTKYHRDGVIEISQGKMLGGSSSLNYMAYMRGDSIDFALWATIANDSSWSYEAVQPLFMKSEKLIDKAILRSRQDRVLHGTKGKLKVRRFYYKRNEKYLKAFAELGHEIVENINSNTPLGFTHLLHTCGKKARQSTAYSFLRPVKDNPRLHVMTYALATKILFDDSKNAVGVKIQTRDNRVLSVRAYREIIISAGVFKTPQLLMLSGIGPKDHLKQKGIKTLVDLPVGQNLQDHPTVVSVIKTGAPDSVPRRVNPHKLGLPIFDGRIALNRNKNYPDYGVRSIILDNPAVFLQLCTLAFSFSSKLCDKLLDVVADKEMLLALNYLSYPKSRGEVRLRSKHMSDQPEVTLGYYTNEEDLDLHAAYLMHFNAILNTTYFRQIGAEFVDPRLGACNKLDMFDVSYWKCYAISMVTSSNYISGTCAMGAVVDSKLNVKGVKRLRVADASVMPSPTASPTASSVIMIAEKASNLIKKAKYET